MTQQGRRRIDRVAAPDFLEGIEERSAQEIHAMRDECRQEEERLSFERRLLQARIDIVRAEQARRRGESTESLIESLPGILADDATSRRPETQARFSPVYSPDATHTRRAGDRAGPNLGELPDIEDRDLDQMLHRLVGDERAISDLRRRVLDHLDRLQAEVAARLQDGSLGADDILRASGWATGDHSP